MLRGAVEDGFYVRVNWNFGGWDSRRDLRNSKTKISDPDCCVSISVISAIRVSLNGSIFRFVLW